MLKIYMATESLVISKTLLGATSIPCRTKIVYFYGVILEILEGL